MAAVRRDPAQYCGYILSLNQALQLTQKVLDGHAAACPAEQVLTRVTDNVTAAGV